MKKDSPNTLVEIFQQAAEHDVLLSFVDAQDDESLTWRDIWINANKLAASLQRDGLLPDEVVAIALPTSRAFAEAYVAIVICGALPFVVSMVSTAADKSIAAERLQYLCHQSSVSLLIADEVELRAISQHTQQDRNPKGVSPQELLSGRENECRLINRLWHEAALVQSSSGSTGKPSCLVLSNKNVITNLRQLSASLAADENNCVVSWLPMYHDMGLVGCFLFPAFCQMPLYLMKPMTFLRRPLRLLYEISKHSGTLSPSPNFAYDRLIAQYSRADKDRLALHTWKAAICGAEPVNPHTMREFVRLYQRFGLSETAFTPCYGMAEATLLVSSKSITTTPQSKPYCLPKQQSSDHQVAKPSRVEIVNCGKPADGLTLHIVNEQSERLLDHETGRILISGDSIFDARYVDGRRINRVPGFYDTGDMGFLSGGQLYVTGRTKDIIIINGKNYSSYFFEHIAERYASNLKGKTLAFGREIGAGTESPAEEAVHLLVETPPGDALCPEAIEKYIAQKTGIKPVVAMVARNSLPRTTSGKLQRRLAKTQYLKDNNE